MSLITLEGNSFEPAIFKMKQQQPLTAFSSTNIRHDWNFGPPHYDDPMVARVQAGYQTMISHYFHRAVLVTT